MNYRINKIKNLIDLILKNDYLGLASEMAYNLILSLFPFAIFAVALFGLLGNPDIINQIINFLGVIAPGETLNLIRDVLNEILNTTAPGLLSVIGLFGALWASSRSILTIMKGINRAYEVQETRSFIKVNIIAIATVIALVLVIFISFNLTILGTTIIRFLDRFLHISDYVSNLVLFVRWPVSFLGLFTLTLIIYYFLPNIHANKRILFKSSAYGALFFSAFWLLGSWLFSLYVENFARYNAVYGTLGAFVVLLVWFYYSSIIMLLGGEISSEIYKQARPKVVEVKYS